VAALTRSMSILGWMKRNVYSVDHHPMGHAATAPSKSTNMAVVPANVFTVALALQVHVVIVPMVSMKNNLTN